MIPTMSLSCNLEIQLMSIPPSLSMSTTKGRLPLYIIAQTTTTQTFAGTMILSPFSKPYPLIINERASYPLPTPIQYFALT